MGTAEFSASSLNARVSLVTGASRGIGLAVARRLAADGALAVCVARDPERLRSAVVEVAQPERQLVDRGFDLLEAEHVRLLLLDEFLDLRLAGADSIHVPGGDL